MWVMENRKQDMENRNSDRTCASKKKSLTIFDKLDIQTIFFYIKQSVLFMFLLS